ncbi:hypothetical protein V8C86DRAFT_742064 [Haematococcus lacustris]
MGRTLQRKRKKEQAAVKQGSVPGVKKHKKGSGQVSIVTAALNERRWDDACAGLHAMRRGEEVPALGTVQRWVRLADLCGEEALVARLLSAILLAIPSARGPLACGLQTSRVAGGAKPSAAGSQAVRRHLPWSPPMTRQQQQQQQQQQQMQSCSPRPGSGQAGCDGLQSPEDYRRCFRAVTQDSSSQAAKRPLNTADLKIWTSQPGTVCWDPDHPPAVRAEVPFVPGAFVLCGVLSQRECRQLVAASEALGYCWDVDYTFTPTPPQTRGSNLDAGTAPSPASTLGHVSALQSSPAVAPSPSGPLGSPPLQQPGLPAEPTHTVGVGAEVEGDQEVEDEEERLEGEEGGGERDVDVDETHFVTKAPKPQQQQPAGPSTSTLQSKAGLAASKQHQQPKAPGIKGGSGQVLPQQAPQTQPGLAAGSSPVPHPLLSAARATAGGDRAAGCVWLADTELLDTLFARVRPLLPTCLGGGQLAGLNARLRLYRYDAGNVYRPHVDGAWPGSGLRGEQLVHDAFGDRWSRLTFLVYLNHGFQGGATTFFTPAPDDPSALDAWAVAPLTGNVLCFPHGDTAGSLVHEGSAVTAGVKYVIRTDVLYMLPERTKGRPAPNRR